MNSKWLLVVFVTIWWIKRSNNARARRISGETLLPLPKYKTKRSRPTASWRLSVHSVTSLLPALSAIAETQSQKEKPYTTGLI